VFASQPQLNLLEGGLLRRFEQGKISTGQVPFFQNPGEMLILNCTGNEFNPEPSAGATGQAGQALHIYIGKFSS